MTSDHADAETNWYDSGCSKRCRYEHTRDFRCAFPEPTPPRLNLHVFETFVASDGNVSGRFREVTVDEAYLEIAKYRADLASRG